MFHPPRVGYNNIIFNGRLAKGINQCMEYNPRLCLPVCLTGIITDMGRIIGALICNLCRSQFEQVFLK